MGDSPTAKRRRLDATPAAAPRESTFPVYLQLSDGSSVCVECEGSWTVGRFKDAAAAALELPGETPADALTYTLEGEPFGGEGEDDVALAETACTADCEVRVDISERTVARHALARRGLDVSPASLVAAVFEADGGLAEELLRAGVSPNAEDRFERPVLIRAVSSRQLPMVEVLLAHGADPHAEWGAAGVNALDDAAEMGAFDILQVLLAHGAEVNRRTENGRTPLMRSCDARVLRVLLAGGADARAVDASGMNALMHACADSHDAVVTREALQLLIDAVDTSDVDRVDAGGVSALMNAAAREMPHAVEMLLAAGADPTRKADCGMTALDYAHYYPPLDVAKRAAVARLLKAAEAGRAEADATTVTAQPSAARDQQKGP